MSHKNCQNPVFCECNKNELDKIQKIFTSFKQCPPKSKIDEIREKVQNGDQEIEILGTLFKVWKFAEKHAYIYAHVIPFDKRCIIKEIFDNKEMLAEYLKHDCVTYKGGLLCIAITL